METPVTAIMTSFLLKFSYFLSSVVDVLVSEELDEGDEGLATVVVVLVWARQVGLSTLE